MQTDAQAGVVTRLAYLPYGALSVASGTVPVAQKFAGRGLNAELGLYYLGARYYDPALGRFITADDRPGGRLDRRDVWNLSAYCLNDPVNNVDPFGHRVAAVPNFLDHYWPQVVSYSVDIGLIIGGIALMAATGGAAATTVGSGMLSAGASGLTYNIKQSVKDPTNRAFNWGAWLTQVGIGGATGLVAGGISAYVGLAVDTAAGAGYAAFAAGGTARFTINIAAGALGNAGASAIGQVLDNLAAHAPVAQGVEVAATIGFVLGGAASVASEAIASNISRLPNFRESLLLDPSADISISQDADGTRRLIVEGAGSLPRVLEATFRNKLLLALPSVVSDSLSDYWTP